jgi:co-chaperonin GroES (HSP10)
MGDNLVVPIHDRIIKSLETRLKSKRDIILPEYKYHLEGPHEADIIVIKPTRCAYAIEVKSTNSSKGRKKALSQLRYDKEFIEKEFGIERIFLFYVHGYKKRMGNLYRILLYNP